MKNGLINILMLLLYSVNCCSKWIDMPTHAHKLKMLQCTSWEDFNITSNETHEHDIISFSYIFLLSIVAGICIKRRNMKSKKKKNYIVLYAVYIKDARLLMAFKKSDTPENCRILPKHSYMINLSDE